MYYLVSGNNLTIEQAAEGAQLELIVMLPIITDRLLESLKLMDELLLVFAKKCIDGIKVNRARCKELLEKSTAYATLPAPKLGYDKVSEIVKEAVKTNRIIREIILDQKLLSNKEFEAIVNSFKP
jgi:aspartate ammonia-lyase